MFCSRAAHIWCDFFANDPAMRLVHVKEFLGHADIQTTMIYIHTKAKDVQHALKGVDFSRLSMKAVSTPATTIPNGQDQK